SSTKLARQSQIFRATVVPSYSIHSLDPLNGCFSLHRCVCQFPNSQSKSCCPSRTNAGRAVEDSRGAIEDAGRAVCAVFSCASPATALTITNKPTKNPPIIYQTITRFAADPFDKLRSGSAAAKARVDLRKTGG